MILFFAVCMCIDYNLKIVISAVLSSTTTAAAEKKTRIIIYYLLSMPVNGSGSEPYCSFRSLSILNSMCSTFAIRKSIISIWFFFVYVLNYWNDILSTKEKNECLYAEWCVCVCVCVNLHLCVESYWLTASDSNENFNRPTNWAGTVDASILLYRLFHQMNRVVFE